MQHFVSFLPSQANFIRLTDKNINQARQMFDKVKGGENINNWAGLSGFNPKNPAMVHDNLQHKLVDKNLYKAATGTDPNTYFRNGSLQQKESKLMPLVQNRQVPKDKRQKVNETVEKLVETASTPYSFLKYNYEPEEVLPLNTRPIMPYVRKKFSEPERLAGMGLSNKLFRKTSNNNTFRQKYIEAMQEDAPFRKSPINLKLESENAALKPADRLRAKMKDRQNYSDVFDTSKYETSDQYIDRNRLLDAYRAKGLMPK